MVLPVRIELTTSALPMRIAFVTVDIHVDPKSSNQLSMLNYSYQQAIGGIHTYHSGDAPGDAPSPASQEVVMRLNQTNDREGARKRSRQASATRSGIARGWRISSMGPMTR
jgi:hypothetical protein